MRFSTLKKKVGFGLAVIILQEVLPPRFWKKLTFKQWIEIYEQAPIESQLSGKALARILELATTSDKWCDIYCRGYRAKQLNKKTAFAKMVELASTFNEWMSVHQISIDGKEGSYLEQVKWKALDKLEELASTLEQLAYIYEQTSPSSSWNQTSLTKMRELVTS